MSKVIKILVVLLSYLILGVIIFAIVVLLLLQINLVQNYVVDRATTLISEKLETQVSIGRIDLQFNSGLVVEDLYIEDLQRDTLIYAGNITVEVRPLDLIRGEVSLGDVSLSDVQFNLIQREVGVSNLKQILMKFKRGDKEVGAPFVMSAKGLQVSNLNFTHRKLDAVQLDYGVNFNDIDITNLSLNSQDISIIDDSITMKINDITLHEKSGFNLNSLSVLKFNISSKGIIFDKLQLSANRSNITLPHLKFISNGWEDYSDFINLVTLDGTVVNSKVDFSTIGYFAPTLRMWDSELNGVDLSLNGPIANLKGVINNVSILGTNIEAKCTIKGLPDITNTNFILDIERLHTSAEDVKMIMEDITGKPFTALGKFESKLDYLSLIGKFSGKLTDFSSNLKLTTNYGVLGVNATMTPDPIANYRVQSSVSTEQFNLGQLLDVQKLGSISLNTTIKASISAQNVITMYTDAKINSLEYNQYSYNGIEMAGTWHDDMFVGALSSADPNLDFSFDGILDFSNDLPKYDFDLDMRNANLTTLNINRHDTVSKISGKVVANASGTTLDDINGAIKVMDLKYINNIDTVRTDSIVLIGENRDDSKYLALNSTFVDIEFRSRTSYRELFDYVKTVLNTYLPTLRIKPEVNKIALRKGVVKGGEDYSLLKIDVKETNSLISVLIPGLYVSEGTKASLLLNPEERTVAILMSSDYIEYKDFLLSGLDLNTRNQEDSLILHAGVKELYVGSMYMPNFSVVGGSKSNSISLATKFNNPDNGRSVMLGFTSYVERNLQTNTPQLRVKFDPSYFKDKEQTWNISSNDIVYDTMGVSIGDFRVINKDQKLIFSGVASESIKDTLNISLLDFDLAPFSQLTESLGYNIRGLISGEAYIASALKGGVVSAGMLFDSLELNGIEMPSVNFNSKWDTKSERLNIELLRIDTEKRVISGYYKPNSREYSADVAMDGIPISILDPLLKSVIGGTEGKADVNVVLSGVGGQFDINGGVSISKFSTLIGFTNVRYGIDSAYVDVKSSVLNLSKAKVFDPNGNSGDFDLKVDLSNFANINYDLKILPNNLMVLNTNMKQSELFYGSIFASGAATIRGDKGGVDMDIRATTAGESQFFLPLSGKSNASTANFIIFEDIDKKEVSPDRNALYRKKLMLKRGSKKEIGDAPNMNINLALNILPNTDLQVIIDPSVGDAIKANGNGVLNLTINPSKNIFSMIGDYEIASGSYMFTLQNIINKKFTIESGSTIKWTGDPINALLDITAIYSLKTSLAPLDADMRGTVPVECKIYLKDRLSQPDVSFGVTIPEADPEIQSLVSHLLTTQEMVSTQFFWLLAINSFYFEKGLSSGSIGEAAGSATGFEFLSNQISNWISSDKFNIGIRYKPKGDMNSNEVNVDFSTHLFENRIFLEVEAGNSASLSNKSAGEIRGDFYLTWLMDKNDNLRMKVFSRTIDSFDQNDWIQDNGVGIYYKASFNVFRDVIESIKKRFSYVERKRRAKIRVERRAARRGKTPSVLKNAVAY